MANFSKHVYDFTNKRPDLASLLRELAINPKGKLTRKNFHNIKCYIIYIFRKYETEKKRINIKYSTEAINKHANLPPPFFEFNAP